MCKVAENLVIVIGVTVLNLQVVLVVRGLLLLSRLQDVSVKFLFSKDLRGKLTAFGGLAHCVPRAGMSVTEGVTRRASLATPVVEPD